MVAKRAGREGQQVVVVQQPRLALAARERVRNRLRHIDQRRQLLLHQPAARLRGNGAILFRQLSSLFAIQRVLAEVATGDGKAVHGRKRAPVRQPVGAASDQLACVGMRRGGLDQLPHHPFDRRRARTGRVHVERCEQRIKALQ